MAIKKSRGSLFTEINITPLTDIFLVLLIIMMVVAPTFQSIDNNIKVPEINSGIAVEQKNATVSVTKDGIFYLNGERVAPEEISAQLTKIKPGLQKKEVVVRADAAAKSKLIMQVMQAAQTAEYEKLIVAGEPLSKKEQKSLKDGDKEKPLSSTEDYNGTLGELPKE